MEALATAEFDAGTKTRRSHHVAAVALRHFEGKDPLAIPSVARSDPFYIVVLGRVLRGPLANKTLPSEARYAQEFLADHGSSLRKRLIGGIAGGRSGRRYEKMMRESVFSIPSEEFVVFRNADGSTTWGECYVPLR